jgi:hypothetical protein
MEHCLACEERQTLSHPRVVRIVVRKADRKIICCALLNETGALVARAIRAHRNTKIWLGLCAAFGLVHGQFRYGTSLRSSLMPPRNRMTHDVEQQLLQFLNLKFGFHRALPTIGRDQIPSNVPSEP